MRTEGEQREKTAADIHCLYLTYQDGVMPEEVIRILIAHEREMAEIAKHPIFPGLRRRLGHLDCAKQMAHNMGWW